MLVASAAEASPKVPLDDPAYEELAVLRARGEPAPFTGGLRPLTEARVRELLGREPLPRELWFRPIDRVRAIALVHHDAPRTYTTPRRERLLVGTLAMSCERTQGRPCGDGNGLVTELESSAGYGDIVSATLAMRAFAGTADAVGFVRAGEAGDADVELQIDRAYVDARLGPVSVEAGRDVLVIGPAARTQVMWGTNAPPVDMLRVGTAAPYDLAGENGASLRGNIQLVLARLRAPQRFPGNIVGIGRMQFDIANNVEIGGTHALQVNGDGAPQLGPIDFVLEHFRRKNRTAGEGDTSNRRLAFDVAFRVAALRGARVYYEVAFEDVRKYFHQAIRHEGDHLLGIQLDGLGRCNHGFVVELQKTGYRSHEHTARTTGFTNRGRIVGSPLGPDTSSVYAGARLQLRGATLYPWLELVRLASDTYSAIEFGPLWRETRGNPEKRYRAGARLRVPLPHSARVDVEAMVERVHDFAYVDGETRNAAGLVASFVWSPGWMLGGR